MTERVLKKIADKCDDEVEWTQEEIKKMERSGEYDSEHRSWIHGWSSAHEGILDIVRKGVI